MLVTTENLAEMLEVTPKTIIKWELSLGLNIKTDDSDIQTYSEELIKLFKEVKSFILNGYTFEEIKELLALEIEYQNKVQKSIKSIIVEDYDKIDGNKDPITLVNKHNSPESNDPLNDELCSSFIMAFNNNNKDLNNQSDMNTFFKSILMELKQSTDRTIEAEKKVYLLENYENRVKNDYLEISSEVKKLKEQLEEKDQKLKDYEEQKKRLNLMEVQLKIMQLEQNKKKFWEFWK